MTENEATPESLQSDLEEMICAGELLEDATTRDLLLEELNTIPKKTREKAVASLRALSNLITVSLGK